jgi:hypothetical protein
LNAGLEKSSQLLNDAQRNANTLSKALEANGLSIHNANGQLITENQLLQTAADLVRRAQSPQDQIAIAQMLGFTKEWIPLLEQGSAAIAGLGDEARRAGALIDDETVQRAADFDKEWRKSSVEFDAYMKSALYGLLPIVDDLIQRAGKFISSFDKGKIQQASDESFKQFREETGIPDSGGIHIDTENLSKALLEWTDSPVSPARRISGARNLLASRAWSGDLSGVGGFTRIPGGDNGKDAVDRAIDSLRKHTEQQLADVQAVGLGDAALARFSATAAETAAVQANGGKETDAQAQKFADLRESAAAAAEALARAKVSSQIDFGNKTMFLSQDDVAIASQLKGIYGNDVPAALASIEAAALRVNTAFRGISSSVESDLVNGLTDIVSGAKSASQGFADLEMAVVKAIEQMIIKITIVEPLMRSLQSTFSGGFNLSGLGFNPIAGVTGSAHGNVFAAGNIVPFANGGIPDVVASPMIAPMAMFGENGEEAIMPLRRGPDGRLGVAAGGAGGSTNVNIHNYTDAQPSVQTAPNGDINVTFRRTMDAGVGDSLANGAGRRVLSQQFGLNQFTGR